MSATFTKENTIPILINSVRRGQAMGAYECKECSILLKALQYFDPKITEKPFTNEQNPENVAVNLLLQGVQKANAHGGPYAFSIEDAALLWDITEFWIREGGKQVAANVGTEEKAKKRKPSAVRSVVAIEEDDEEDEEDEEKTPSKISPLVDPRKAQRKRTPEE